MSTEDAVPASAEDDDTTEELSEYDVMVRSRRGSLSDAGHGDDGDERLSRISPLGGSGRGVGGEWGD